MVNTNDIPRGLKIVSDVTEHGWCCVNVAGNEERAPFSYTIGLFKSYGHSELMIYGLSGSVAHAILNTAAEAAKAGHPFDLRKSTDELIDHYACVFVSVPQKAYEKHVGLARWFYQGDEFPLHQVVWPSRSGHFPWEPDSPEGFSSDQPILGHYEPSVS